MEAVAELFTKSANKGLKLSVMSQTQTIPAALPVESRLPMSSVAESILIPWAIWFVVAGVSTILLGLIWDTSWHMSVGRDMLWTPPHILMQLSAILIGIACTHAVLATTFAVDSPARDATVRVLGFHAPGGAFIAGWSCVAMLATTPFDNWWHNAYGLDAKILTPPHVLAVLASFICKTGAMAWMASIINRSQEVLRGRLAWLLLIVGSVGVVEISEMITEPTWFTNMHTAGCYLAVAVFIPAMMIAPGWGSAQKWGCTILAALYTAIGLGSEWLLPLIPAQPKLGPVYHNITHLVPLRFPLLLIVPAFVADLLLQKLKQRSSWTKAIWLGPAFLISFLAVQWPFASFLISPGARNWIFGTAYFAYIDPAGILYDPYKFNVTEKTPGIFLLTMVMALVVSIVMVRLGLAWGDWMRRIRR